MHILGAYEEPFLLFGKTRPGTISGISLKSAAAAVPPTNRMLNQIEIIPPIRNLDRPTSIGYFYSKTGDSTIFFSDATTFSIRFVRFNPNDSNSYDLNSKDSKDLNSNRKFNETKSEPKILIPTGISNCEGIAIDYIGRNIFWTDEGLLSISVAKFDQPEIRKIVAAGNLTHPRSIAFDPMAGLLFWTDWADGLKTDKTTDKGGRVKKMAQISDKQKSSEFSLIRPTAGRLSLQKFIGRTESRFMEKKFFGPTLFLIRSKVRILKEMKEKKFFRIIHG